MWMNEHPARGSFITVTVNNSAVNQQVGTQEKWTGICVWNNIELLSHRAVNQMSAERIDCIRKHFDRIQYLEYNLTSFVVLFISHHIPITRRIVQMKVSACSMLISGRDRQEGWTLSQKLSRTYHQVSNRTRKILFQEKPVWSLIKMMGFPNSHSQHDPTRICDGTFKTNITRYDVCSKWDMLYLPLVAFGAQMAHKQACLQYILIKRDSLIIVNNIGFG